MFVKIAQNKSIFAFKKIIQKNKKNCKSDSKNYYLENDHQQIYLIANFTSSAFTVFLPAWRANPTAFCAISLP